MTVGKHENPNSSIRLNLSLRVMHFSDQVQTVSTSTLSIAMRCIINTGIYKFRAKILGIWIVKKKKIINHHHGSRVCTSQILVQKNSLI